MSNSAYFRRFVVSAAATLSLGSAGCVPAGMGPSQHSQPAGPADTAAVALSAEGTEDDTGGRRVQGTGGAEYATDHFLLEASDDASAHKAAARAGGRVIGKVAGVGVSRVAVPAGTDIMAAIGRAHGPGVNFAEPDYIAQAHYTPNDPDYVLTCCADNALGKGWHLGKIAAGTAWDLSRGAGVKIAILDTGLDLTHPELAAKIDFNIGCGDGGLAGCDGSGANTADHGTHVGGIAAGSTDDATGVAATGFNARLLAINVFTGGSAYYSDVAEGIDQAIANGAKVINMSLGGTSGSSTLQAAVRRAAAADIVIVASAGNSNSTKANYPAYYTECIAVAATTRTDARAYYSNYGKWVDIAAPGGGDTKMAFTATAEGVWSTLPQSAGSYGYKQGTSMAAPVVSGAAALVWATSYGTSAASVRSRLTSTGDAVAWTSYFRRLNAARAVGAI